MSIYNGKTKEKRPRSLFPKMPCLSQNYPCTTQGWCCVDARISFTIKYRIDTLSFIALGITVDELLKYFEKKMIFHLKISRA